MVEIKASKHDDLDPAELLLPSENEPPDKTAPKSNSSKSKKVLTNTKRKLTMVPVITLRKDEKLMEPKTPKTKKQSKSFDWQGAIKSVAWLVEAAFRGFVGWILLSNFDNTLTVAVAIYALGTAGVIVVMHFVRAHRK